MQKKINTSYFKKLALISAVCAASMSPFTQAESDTNTRIEQLEKIVKELQQTLNQQKRSLVTTQDLSMANANNLKSVEIASGSDPDHSYKFGGFIKVTGSASEYSDGDIGKGLGRDIYVPGLIPVKDSASAYKGSDTQMQAKESRINFVSKHNLANGSKIKTYLEMDFLGSSQGNERVSNSYSPRLRHAFFTYDNWLFGQTWTTFQNVGALPESADFLAASEGIIFGRQTQIRYTNGNFQFSLENPETTITPNGGGARIVNNSDTVPDFIVRYNLKGNWGNMSAALLARQLAYEDGANKINESTSALGLSLTGKFMLGKDDIRWNINTGSGMGRYVGLNTANGAVINATGSLEAIDSTSGSVAYRHHWNERWRSNFILSAMMIDNDTDLTGMSVTSDVQSAQVNLLFSPTKSMTLGGGLLMANREIESGDDGDLTRLILTAKYGF